LSVDLRLRKHDYFKSLYSLVGYPSAIEVSSIVEEYLQGLSIVTRGFYDPQGITHGWTVYSSQAYSKLFTSIHTRASIEGVSTEKRLSLECIVQAIHCIRVIGEVHGLSDGKITLFLNSKGIMRLLLGIRYHNVSCAIADNCDLLAELKYQLTCLDKVATIKFSYCDLEAKTGDAIPRQYISDLGADFNPHRVALSFPLLELQYINPPHNAVQLFYNGQPFLTKVKSTLRQDMY
jgi:hypothetical protein